MSLNYNLAHISDWENLCFIEAPADEPTMGITKGDRRINPLTETLIFLTVGVGIGDLTEANASEFYARLRFIEKLDGPMLIRAQDPETGKRPEGVAAFITPDEVRQHIGLSTNVSTESRAKWMKRFANDLDRSMDAYDAAKEAAIA